ncbi:hypothetical protein FACS1894179_06570 [Bacteroidia bacterium]|nr:hypothetical protein FACS1894169_05790 [Bacteroidia bacterium]GHV40278.1 hypothetical protein FACS1894179_06570 [Bacteroidia bacterium]
MIRTKTSGKKTQILFVTSVCSVFILVFILNKLYPLFADDWFYSFVYNDKYIRVGSLFDIFDSQYNHYFVWGGRSIVHAIDQLLLMMDFPVICVLNSFAFVIFIYVLYKITNRDNKVNPFVFILFSLLIWFSQPAFFETVIWKTGSVNYLWGGAIVFLFMYPYYKYYRSGKSSGNLFKVVLFFLCGVVAGWTNENMAIALIFFIVLLLFKSHSQKMAIPKWAIAGLAGTLTGAAFLLLAPGNYARLEEVKTTYGWHDITFLKALWIGIKNILRYFFHYIMPLLGIYVLLLCVYNRYPRNAESIKINVRSSILFITTGFIALGAMIGSLIFPERSLFGIIVLFLIPIGIIYANIDFSQAYFRYLNTGVMVIFLLLFLNGYYKATRDLYGVNTVFAERELYIEEQKNKGIDSVVFTKAMPVINEKKYFIRDLTNDPNGLTNKAYARYHGLKSVNLVVNKKEEN